MELTKDIQIVRAYTVTEQQITDHPTWLHGINCSQAAAAVVTVICYDGFTSAAPVKFRIRGKNPLWFPIDFGYPIYFERGIFLTVSASTTSVYTRVEYPGKPLTSVAMSLDTPQNMV